MHQHSRKMSNRTNTQMMISFAQNEAHLVDQLAQIAKKRHYTKSGWVKEKIRQEYKNLDLVGVQENLMKQKVLLTQETYRALSKAAKSKQLTPDELCEITLQRDLKIK